MSRKIWDRLKVTAPAIDSLNHRPRNLFRIAARLIPIQPQMPRLRLP